MIHYRFLEPLDVLFLRGNKLFGDPGSYGESLVPPWPSVAAGALRSQMYAQTGEVLTDPEHFAVTTFQLGRRRRDGSLEAIYALPADLLVVQAGPQAAHVRVLTPRTPAAGLLSSSPLMQLPMLAEDQRSKPASGYWLNAEGWARYLGSQPPEQKHLVHSTELWALDSRIGVGLDSATRRADDGKLFSMQAIAFHDGVGFLTGVAGTTPVEGSTIRLGGDGRAAVVHAATGFKPAEPDYAAIAKAGRCRLVLTSPGLFPDDWRPPGIQQDGHWELGEISGKLVAAAVSRAEIVSGWDLALWQPKAAERAAPAGSVYWLEELKATPEALRKLSESGLWRTAEDNPARRVEGFNRFTFAAA